jgi:uncharacterized membrane protein YfcA
VGAEWFLLVLGAAVAGLVQGIAGFGFSTVAMSFWVWGLDPVLAAAMAVFGSWCGQVVAAVSVRRPWRWPTLWPFLAGAALGIPLGVVVLPYLNPDHYKLLFGCVLLIWCPAMLFSQSLPQLHHGGRWADGLAGGVGGLMGGIGGVTGLAPTLWCTLRGMNKALQRDVVQNFNLTALSATLLVYLWRGTLNVSMLPSVLWVGVALLVPSLLGSRIYKGLSDLAFRRVVLLLLTFSGLAMVLASGFRLLR